MVASIQPACLVYRVQMRPAFIHPRIDISGRLANLKASANRSRNHIRFNHARFNSVQQQTLPAAFVADIFGRYPLRLRKWPNSSLESFGRRVIKHNRGKRGHGIWKVERPSPSNMSDVLVLEA